MEKKIAELEAKIKQLEYEKEQLGKAIEILAHSKFMDCFHYECGSPNECQTFGCKKAQRRKEIQKNYELENGI